MIRKFIDRLMGKAPSGAHALGHRVEIPVSQHGIDPHLLDEHAVRVVRTLQDAGHQAYIVGGAVRDLLVGRRPKDFDVATDATPERVKSLFRRAFIIGRRFRIVHVVFGRGREHEVIEVSTFRALLDAEAAEQVAGNEKTSKAELAGKKHVVDASGRVLRDNVWGPQIEDAARRDFTINAMYFDPVTQTVVDYHKGFSDVRSQVLRMIGDPATRYREDPVRILRVVRFAAKLKFKVEAKTAKPIAAMVPLLANVPASRMFDEMIKLMQTGHALASLEALRQFGLDQGVFPILDAACAPQGAAGHSPQRERFIRLALEDTDRRVADDRPVAPSFLLACMLWHDVQDRWHQLQQEGLPSFPALQQAIDAVFDARIGDISGRGKLAADMREIWQMQPRFERRTPSASSSLIEQPRFRAGFDFLRLRSDMGEVPADLAEWWEDFSLGSEEDREALLRDIKSQAPRRVHGTKKSSATSEGATLQQVSTGEPSEHGEPARKRRRRRRRGAGTGAGASSDGSSDGGPPSGASTE